MKNVIIKLGQPTKGHFYLKPKKTQTQSDIAIAIAYITKPQSENEHA